MAETPVYLRAGGTLTFDPSGGRRGSCRRSPTTRSTRSWRPSAAPAGRELCTALGDRRAPSTLAATSSATSRSRSADELEVTGPVRAASSTPPPAPRRHRLHGRPLRRVRRRHRQPDPGRDRPRARYRDGMDRPSLVERGAVVPLRDRPVRDQLRRRRRPPSARRRLVVVLRPLRPRPEHGRADRGGDRAPLVADQLVHHDRAATPSFVLLPVVAALAIARYRRAPAAPRGRLGRGQHERAVDEREVRERLREVAELAPRGRVVLLRRAGRRRCAGRAGARTARAPRRAGPAARARRRARTSTAGTRPRRPRRPSTARRRGR